MRSDAWELFDPSIAPRDGDLTTYLRCVLLRCGEWFNASGATIFLHEEGIQFALAAAVGTENTIPADSKVVVGRGVAGICLESGKPMLVGDPSKDPTLAGKLDRLRPELGTALVVPLTLPDGSRSGVMNLSRSAGADAFNGDDLGLATALGYQIALAVGNAKLLVETNRSHEELTSVVEAMPMAVFVYRPDGSMARANAAARDLLLNEQDWLPTADEPEGRRKVFDRCSDRTWQIRCVRPTGSVVITVEEITFQEREDRERNRIKRLAEIGQMSAAIAHEIRNPLTSIRSAAQMVTLAPEQADEFAKIIEEEVGKLNDLCEEFLEFARPLPLRCVPTTLAEICTNLIAKDRRVLEEKGISLHLETPGTSPTMYLDVLRVEQVLRNLIRNAAEACTDHGFVLVRVEDTAFEVEDNGIGMDEQTVDKLFTPFFTMKAQGTGLGLSNVRKIVEAHGGSISVESRAGYGTCFRIDFGRDD